MTNSRLWPLTLKSFSEETTMLIICPEGGSTEAILVTHQGALIDRGVSFPLYWYYVSVVFALQIPLVQFTCRPKLKENKNRWVMLCTLRSVCSVFVRFMCCPHYLVSDRTFILKIKCVDKPLVWGKGKMESEKRSWTEENETKSTDRGFFLIFFGINISIQNLYYKAVTRKEIMYM